MIVKIDNMRVPSLLARCASLLLAAVAALPAHADHGGPDTVRIGVLAFKGSKEVTEDWTHLKDWLERSVTGHRFTLLDFDRAALTQSVRERTVDFVLTNSGHYVDLEHTEGVSRIATLASPWAASPAQSIGSAIVVRREAPMQALPDLRGKRVLAVAPDAFGGYLVAAHELAAQGVDPENDIGEWQFVGFPLQQIVHAVREGKAAAGVVRACMLEQMVARGEIPADALRVLAPVDAPGLHCQSSTRLYPDWPFATLRHTSRELAKQVALALLSMPPSQDGYSWTVPGDYQVVDDLYRDLRIGRYAALRTYALDEMARRYWGWILLVFGLLLAWLAHTIRVEYLINQRTRALQAAQAERVRMEEDARNRQAALDHAARLAILGEMASAIAHELNQPLAAIRNYANGIARRVRAGRMEPDPLLEGAGEIAAQSERAATIIRNIRAFARKNAPGLQNFDLVPVVDEAIAMFAGAHPHARMQRPPATEPVMVCADRVQLQQVLLNLLKNAYDAQQAAGCVHEPVTIDIVREEGQCRVSVHDRGCGLLPGQIERLFEPFFTTKADGFGLGLSLSKNIIEACGGTLSAIENSDGRGLTVWFSLPVSPTKGSA